MTQHPAFGAVAALIRRPTLHIQITEDVAYTAHGDCLLTQLADAIGLGSEQGGRGVPSSRPPVSMDALVLWTEIQFSASVWAGTLDVDRRKYLQPAVRDAGGQTPPVGRLLRAVAAQAVSTGREPVADRIAHNADKWARQIRAMLHGQHEQRAVRGAVCEACGATHILELRDNEHYRQPAIALVTHEDTLRWLTCRACGWYGAITDDGADLTYVSETELNVKGMAA